MSAALDVRHFRSNSLYYETAFRAGVERHGECRQLHNHEPGGVPVTLIWFRPVLPHVPSAVADDPAARVRR